MWYELRRIKEGSFPPYLSLPKPERSVLRPRGVELPVGREPDAVDWAEVALEALDLGAALVVVLVQLEVVAAAHEDLPVGMQRGRVHRAGDVKLLDLVQAEMQNCTKFLAVLPLTSSVRI